MAAARGPLTLRDFLACDSSSDGFRSYPRFLPTRADDDAALHLIVEAADLLPSRSPPSFFRSPGALARISSLSRSFSRRIKDGFWRRRDDDDDLYADLDDRDSCGFPSPLVSSCSDDSASELSTSEAADDLAVDDKMASTSASERDKPSSSSSPDHHCTDGGASGAAADGNEMQAVAAEDKLGRAEDKQQLSPVSVLDFPFDDDDRSDAGTCSPSFSFQRCCPTTPPDLLLHSRTTTTKQQAQLLHKIRRYEGVAEAVDPVDLEARFTATSDSGESLDDASTHLATTTSCTDTTTSISTTTTTAAPRHDDEHQSVERPSSPPDQEEPDEEYRLLARLLRDDDTAAAVVDDDEVSQVLLLDFFAEGIDRLRCSSMAAGSVVGISWPVDDDHHQNKLVGAAAEWLRGAGPQWGIRDVMLSGKAAIEDMDCGRRWMSVADEEEREVGAEVEGLVMDELVDDLVVELAVLPWWHNHSRRWWCH